LSKVDVLVAGGLVGQFEKGNELCRCTRGEYSGGERGEALRIILGGELSDIHPKKS